MPEHCGPRMCFPPLIAIKSTPIGVSFWTLSHDGSRLAASTSTGTAVRSLMALTIWSLPSTSISFTPVFRTAWSKLLRWRFWIRTSLFIPLRSGRRRIFSLSSPVRLAQVPSVIPPAAPVVTIAASEPMSFESRSPIFSCKLFEKHKVTRSLCHGSVQLGPLPGRSHHRPGAHAVDHRADAELLVDVGGRAGGGELRPWPEASQ
jgi:hypothetical protein